MHGVFTTLINKLKDLINTHCCKCACTKAGFQVNTCPRQAEIASGKLFFRLNLLDEQANKTHEIKQHQTRLFRDAI